MTERDGIWTFVEQFEGKPSPVSFELIGKARELADILKVKVSAIILGYNISHLSKQVIGYGADKAYIIDDIVLKDYRNEPYYKTVVSLVKEHNPEALLFGATVQGRDLAGSVATETRSGLTADCTALDIDPENKKLLQTRPAYGGNIMATIWCRNEATQMATVRPRVMPMPTFDKNRKGEIIKKECQISEEEINAKIINFQLIEKDGEVDLPYADIIVSVGKGIASSKNLEKSIELAEVLGAHLGASRGAVDMGLLGHDHQVGQTGKTVRSKVYFAIGISGAVQHLVGMQSSDFIIAINHDPKAAIFNVADIGIVGDLNKVVPLLVEELKKRKTDG